ncbi:MAG: winged helix-turn-helix domain-containing protein [Terriglobales bacterium]
MPLKPKALQTLLLLVENRGHLLAKDDFLKRLWPNTFVEEVVLAQNISQLRKALATGSGDSFIETVPRLGYRFVAAVEVIAKGDDATSPAVVAVLPFENIGGSPEQEYLADGLTEEVIAALGQVDPARIQVIGRTSVMAYKRSEKSLAEIGHELAAAFLLESSMRTESGRIRVMAKLIRATDQVQIWASSFDAEPTSMLTFQRELSRALAEQIRLRLSPARLNALTKRQTANAEAYDAYLRGRYYWNHFTPTTTRRAVECFGLATELDPTYALAWSGIADAFSSAPIHADADPAQVWPKAKQAVQSALRSDPELPETQTSLGLLKFWLDWDWKTAESALRHALRLDASYSLAHRTLGILLAHRREDAEARGEMERARSLDPLDAMHHALSAQVAFVTRDFQSALEYAHQSSIILPDFWIGYYQAAQAHVERGEYSLALEGLRKAAEFGARNSKVMSLRAYALAQSGQTDEALAGIASMKATSHQSYFPPYAIALVHAGLRDADAAFEWLDRSLQYHDVHLALLPADPKWDWVRSHPRFVALLEHCGMTI